MKAPDNCLQWYTGKTGTIESFNFKSGILLCFFLFAGGITFFWFKLLNFAINIGNGKQLSGQDYSICIRAEKGYCSLCFSANSGIGGSSSYGIFST